MIINYNENFKNFSSKNKEYKLCFEKVMETGHLSHLNLLSCYEK